MPIRKEILNYVSCIRPFVKDEFKDKYMQMWDDILNLSVVEERIYNPGKQQNTNFNRKLVAEILHFLDSKKIYEAPFNAKVMTEALEHDWEHSVRRELAFDPSDDIKDAITPENRKCVDYLFQAMRELNIVPLDIAMRGGTDGSYISTKGIPTPNYFTGAHNFHSRCEFMPMGAVENSCRTTLKLIELITNG